VKGNVVRKLLLLAALAVLICAASATSAAADTWNGTCNIKGSETNDPPYTYVVQFRNYDAYGTGTCTGTLNGAPYNGPAALHIDGRMNSPMSCEAGVTTTTDVPGTLTFGDPNSTSSPQVGLLVANVHSFQFDNFLVQGAYNGYAYARWQLGVTPQTLVQCAQQGLAKLDFTLTMQTIKELYG
jgi:hypothetical protein